MGNRDLREFVDVSADDFPALDQIDQGVLRELLRASIQGHARLEAFAVEFYRG